MAVSKFMTTNKILEYLHQEIDNITERYGVCKLDSLVWEDQDNPRDNYIGYFMQITNPYINDDQYDLDNLTENQSEIPSKYHIEKEKWINEIQDLIDYSRNIIGLSLLYKDLELSSIKKHDLSSVYYTIYCNLSMIMLDMSTDRIRDFVIKYWIDSNLKRYKRNLGNPADKFKRPFCELKEIVKDHYQQKGFFQATKNFSEGFIDEINGIGVIVDNIAEKRQIRNNIVHECSTKESAIIDELWTKIIPGYVNFSDDEFELENKRDANLKSNQMKVEDTKNIMIDWHKLSIELGDIVFKAEFLTRNKC